LCFFSLFNSWERLLHILSLNNRCNSTLVLSSSFGFWQFGICIPDLCDLRFISVISEVSNLVSCIETIDPAQYSFSLFLSLLWSRFIWFYQSDIWCINETKSGHFIFLLLPFLLSVSLLVFRVSKATTICWAHLPANLSPVQSSFHFDSFCSFSRNNIKIRKIRATPSITDVTINPMGVLFLVPVLLEYCCLSLAFILVVFKEHYNIREYPLYLIQIYNINIRY